MKILVCVCKDKIESNDSKRNKRRVQNLLKCIVTHEMNVKGLNLSLWWIGYGGNGLVEERNAKGGEILGE